MNIPRETLIKIINGDQEEIEKIKEKLGFKEKKALRLLRKRILSTTSF